MLDHNKSIVKVPACLNRNKLKKLVLLSSLRERERTLLHWILDQAETWTITVAQIRTEMQWGEDKWATVRRSLVSRGVLEHVKERRGSVHFWTLLFDFHPVLPPDLSTATIKTPVSRARARETPEKSGYRATPGHDPGIARDALEKPGIDLNTLPESPPQAGCGGDFEKNRTAATGEQRQILDSLVANQSANVQHPAAWRGTLARKAAAGLLTRPSAQTQASSSPPKRNKSLLGFIAHCPPHGQIKVIERGDFATPNGDLRGDDADQIWRRYEQGKVVFLPPPIA